MSSPANCRAHALCSGFASRLLNLCPRGLWPEASTPRLCDFIWHTRRQTALLAVVPRDNWDCISLSCNYRSRVAIACGSPADERVPESSGGFEALHAPCSLALEQPCPSWCGQYLCNALLHRMTLQCAYLGLQVAFKSWSTAGHAVLDHFMPRLIFHQSPHHRWAATHYIGVQVTPVHASLC